MHKSRMTIISLNILLIISIVSCKGQSSRDLTNHNFTANKTEYYPNGNKKCETDSITGYRKYYYQNGQLQGQGKVVNNYFIGLTQAYSENGLLLSEVNSDEKGKLSDKEFIYYNNNKIMNETYEYFEGNHSDKVNFKFHKIEKVFYKNGQLCVEQHLINDKLYESKCWDTAGNEKPIEYSNTIEVKNLIRNKSEDEEKFIAFIKMNKIDSCIMFFAPSVINKYGLDSLKKELKNLNEFFSKYPNQETTELYGKPSDGIGTFGHDADGNIEKKSLYHFFDIDSNVVYYFSLYSTDRIPTGIIKYYDSKNLSDIKLRKLK